MINSVISDMGEFFDIFSSESEKQRNPFKDGAKKKNNFYCLCKFSIRLRKYFTDGLCASCTGEPPCSE
jgi:hypothetical protein